MSNIPDRLIAYRIGTSDDVYVLDLWGHLDERTLIAGIADEHHVSDADVRLLTSTSA
ncbi:MAG: hypothetical protein ACJ768_11800 [Gaiellaceae bacterium]